MTLPPLPPPPPGMPEVRAVLGLPAAPGPAGEPESVSPGPAVNTGGGLEARVTATVGAGREVMKHAGDNASSAANTFEGRVSQGNL